MTRVVRFHGGPEDGAEKRFGGQLMTTVVITGAYFVWKKDEEIVGRGRKVYTYRFSTESGRAAYHFVGERVEIIEGTDGGEPDAEVRGRGDSPGPEPEPEPDDGIVGGVE